MSSANLKKIEQKIRDAFYDLFVNYDSLDLLGNLSSYKSILKDIITFGNDLAGKEVMPSLEAYGDHVPIFRILRVVIILKKVLLLL